MNFDESYEYLLNLGNEVLAMKLGLENITKVLDALGNPEKKYLKVQIAGTNGKGSTCAFLDAICVSAQINTGLFTSPHLVSITERIKINGAEISEKDFARYATKIRKICEKLVETGKLETVPTYFEQVTAIALTAFAESAVELVILETGIGGRFDATTAANAEIVAITPIDYDHQNILGNSLTEIAAEKAAIIREDTKVVLARQKTESLKIILERCADFGVLPETTHFPAEVIDSKDYKLIVNFQTRKAGYPNVKLNLSGRHQIENAKTAILLAEILSDYFDIAPENVVEGLENAVHRGRLEFGGGILFDGAHNIAGAKALREFLDEFIYQPLTLVFGAMREKDLTEIAEILFPLSEKIVFTSPDNPRSMTTAELTAFLPDGFNKKNVFQIETVEAALNTAKEISGRENLICVTGSLYLVGEAQKILNNKSKKTE